MHNEILFLSLHETNKIVKFIELRILKYEIKNYIKLMIDP